MMPLACTSKELLGPIYRVGFSWESLLLGKLNWNYGDFREQNSN